MSLLEVQDFNYYYGNIHAVKGVSLYVDEGEIVTIIGSNGAGKTTTLQTISGLTSPKGVYGQIKFNGESIAKLSGDKIAARGLAHCLEGRRIFSKLTVEENLLTGAYLRKDTNRINNDLESIYARFPQLLERRTQLGGTLSGGEQQMLAIGRALIARPKMILLDEPSLGLAPLIIREVFAAIKEINKEGTTILFVEQNSNMALRTASRAYVMQVGEVVITDTSENLKNNEEIKKAYLGG